MFAFLSVLPLFAGCVGGGPSTGELDIIWGRRGLSAGRLQKPRAMALRRGDGQREDEIYLVDMTARIQAFTPEGKFLRGWQTPKQDNGRPSGLSFDNDGNLLVADTHYYRVLIYTPEGKRLRQIGGTLGNGPGEFGFVTDAVQDSQGFYYVAEYGEYDRIQKFTRDRKYVKEWGGHGSEPGQFVRPQNMAIDDDDHIWVCDACNHRIQVFDTDGKLLKLWGKKGRQAGELNYPYDLTFDAAGEHVYIIEYANHRVQKFTLDGKSRGCWGTNGREPGQMHNPWALVRDSQNRLHLLDTNNHRVQRIRGL